MATRDATDLNMDELFRQMELDETEDAPLITPVNFAKIRPITPQQIYYLIRTHKVTVRICACGRKCVVKEEVDAYFRALRGEQAWPYGEPDREIDDEEPSDADLDAEDMEDPA
jgi:hypothetical protein